MIPLKSYCPYCGAPTDGDTPWTACKDCVITPEQAAYDAFVDMLDNPPPPSPALVTALSQSEPYVALTLTQSDWESVLLAITSKSWTYPEYSTEERRWLDLYDRVRRQGPAPRGD